VRKYNKGGKENEKRRAIWNAKTASRLGAMDNQSSTEKIKNGEEKRKERCRLLRDTRRKTLKPRHVRNPSGEQEPLSKMKTFLRIGESRKTVARKAMTANSAYERKVPAPGKGGRGNS